MQVPLKEIAEYARRATTEELLDRVTIYRDGMEPFALDLMEGELDRRKVTRDEIAAHDARRRAVAILRPDGSARRCEKCDRPAVHRHRGWHKVFAWLPVFKRTFYLCEEHRPAPNPDAPPGS